MAEIFSLNSRSNSVATETGDQHKIESRPASEFAIDAILNDNEAMSDTVSRYELDAKLETIEARMDARIARIEDSNKRIEQGMSSLKTTVIVTGVSAFLAVVAANIGLVQTMFAAFESGKTTAAAINEATSQLRQTQDQLKAIQDRLDSRASQIAAPPKK